MLSKRIFWLACVAVVGWLLWMRLRQRQDEFAASIPQFAPPRTFAPPIPAPPPAPLARQPDPAEPLPATPAADTPPASTESANIAVDAPEVAEDVEPPAPFARQPDPAEAPATPPAADTPEVAEDAEIEISGYCMRCKTKRPIQNAHRETTESGRPAARGTCPICGANMFTFLATDDA
jgi:hypothetical protein